MFGGFKSTSLASSSSNLSNIFFLSEERDGAVKYILNFDEASLGLHWIKND